MRGASSLLSLASIALLSCSSGIGGGGDLDNVTPQPTTLGTPIADAENPAHPLVKYCGNECPATAKPEDCAKDCPTIDARNVVIIAIDNFDEQGTGKSAGNIFAQDAVQNGPKGTPFSGILLFRAQVVPATLTLAPGMGVELIAPFQPYPGPGSATNLTGYFADGSLPETNGGSITLSYEGADPAPIDITTDDLVNDPKAAMQYVGRLVRISNVFIQDGGQSTWNEKYHQASIEPTGKVKLGSEFFDIEGTYGGAPAGTNFKSITGVLDYFYEFVLAPRSSDDIVVK